MSTRTFKYRSRVKRLPIEGFSKKNSMTKEEMKELFEDNVLIEEKLDGKTFYLEIGNKIFVGERLDITHTVHYKNLPDSVLFFDVFEEGRFLGPVEKINKILEIGGTPVPIIYCGKVENYVEFCKKLVFDESAFYTDLNPKMKKVLEGINLEFFKNRKEGIVVKNWKKQLLGKLVNPWFEEIIGSTGRYEGYPNRNVIKLYRFEDYVKYLYENVERALRIEIPNKKDVYEKYVTKWRTWF
ncbi:MAG: RNA ligase family protein [Candidatus Aenigmarchaeota archaeon]|nr:RNA ligase family protein [Candidatus Aenigmarchaeota archaeon]